MDSLNEIKRLRNKFLKSYNDGNLEKAANTGAQLIDYYKNNRLTYMDGYEEDLFNIACTYDELNQYDKAEPLYILAADRIAEEFGSSITLSNVYNNLGILNSNRHRFDTALAYFKKCYNIRYNLLEETDVSMIDAAYNLGTAYKNLHRFSDAVQYYAKALNNRKKHGIAYADNLYNLGMCYAEIKEEAIGIGYMQGAVEIYNNNPNPDEYISAAAFYALILCRAKRYAEAADIYVVVLEKIHQGYGKTQPVYANIMTRLADCYAKLDDIDKAISVKQEAAALIKTNFGANHVLYANCYGELGELYMRKNDLGRAQQAYLTAYNIKAPIMGINNEECIAYVHKIANLYKERGQYGAAESYLNGVLDKLMPEDKHYTDILLCLVKVYMLMQNGEGINRLFALFNKLHPEKSFDEMLDMAEEK